MSPRSNTDRLGESAAAPGWPPRSTAVTEFSDRPVVTSSGSPARAASTFCCVLGRVSPISDSRWMA
jgi:hypothetical protein